MAHGNGFRDQISFRGAVKHWEDPEELARALERRDEEAWRFFIGEHGRLIYGVLARFDLSPSDRDDLFQETCLTIIRAVGSLRDPKSLLSWVYSITYRLAIDAKRKARPATSLEEIGEERLRTPDPWIEPHFAKELEELQLAARTADGIGRLDPRCRNLLTALYIEDPPRSYQEISRQLGIPVGSIGPSRARCLEKLRLLLFSLSKPTRTSSTELGGPSDTPS